jgi:hypothetical protein
MAATWMAHLCQAVYLRVFISKLVLRGRSHSGIVGFWT